MKMKTEQQLKEEYLSWIESVEIRKLVYDSAKFYLKEQEDNLKEAKKIFNLAYKDWKKAREEVIRSKRRWKNQPYKIRKWALEHMGEVFKLLENTEK